MHVFDEQQPSQCDNSQHICRNHFFDVADTHTSYRSHKTDLSSGLNPQRGVYSMCRYYKTDESTVDPCKRAHMKATEIDSAF